MKKIILIIITFVLCSSSAFTQEFMLEELSPFDKIIINGNVEEVQLVPAVGETPVVRVTGASENNVTAEVLAGTLNLTINGNEAVALVVYNRRVKRISGPEDMQITGAEVIGGASGNYLVVSFDHRHGGAAWAWAGSNFNIHIPDIDIPEIPEIDVDIPALDFDFEHLDNEWKYHWEEHQKELRLWNRELSDEMKEAMEEARKQMKQAREQMEEARKELQELREED